MKKALIISITILLSLFVKAQNTPLIDTTLKYNVEHDVSLDTATRAYDRIKVIKPEVEVEKQTYSELEKEAELQKITPKIVAYKIGPAVKTQLFKNYIRAGFGNYITPFGELYIMSGRSDEYQYGLHLKHRSSINGPVDNKNSGQSYNGGDLFAEYKLSDKVNFGTKINYERDGVHYYGYDPEIENIDRDSIKQTYNTFDMIVYTKYKNRNLALNLGAGYRRTTSKFDNSESDIKFSLNGENKIGNNKVIFEGQGFLSQYEDSSKYTRNFFRLKPYYRFNLSDFHIDFGMNVVFESDTLNSEKNSHFYPFFDFKYVVSQAQRLYVYGGFGGDMKRNTYQSFLDENLYLNQQLFINNSNELLHFYVGANTQIVDDLIVDFNVSYKNIRNLHYFVNSLEDRSKFDIVYDDKEVKQFDVNLEISYALNRRLLLGWKNAFHSYANFTPDKVIHRPNYEMDLTGKYSMNDKLSFGLDAFYLGGLNAYDQEQLTFTKLEGIFDINVNAEYRLNKRISAFAEVNNILSKQYQRYLYYRAKGINFLIGGTLSF